MSIHSPGSQPDPLHRSTDSPGSDLFAQTHLIERIGSRPRRQSRLSAEGSAVRPHTGLPLEPPRGWPCPEGLSALLGTVSGTSSKQDFGAWDAEAGSRVRSCAPRKPGPQRGFSGGWGGSPQHLISGQGTPVHREGVQARVPPTRERERIRRYRQGRHGLLTPGDAVVGCSQPATSSEI